MKSRSKSLTDLMQQEEILLQDILELLKNVFKTQAKLFFFILLSKNFKSGTSETRVWIAFIWYLIE